MLEADDVDDDYFTPVSGSSLANIFQSPSVDNEENSSLKYIPAKPSTFKKVDESKPTECVVACALFAYEWFDDVYNFKGKVGFAILKTIKSDMHNIFLYDSKKVALSCTTIQPALVIKLKGNTYLSFHDNTQKYWSVYGALEEIKNVVETLQKLNVQVEKERVDNGPSQAESSLDLAKVIPVTENSIKESDTDSSANRKTKASILSRMATMGHSILPQQTLLERTSDSSDTNDNYDHKISRHKSSKTALKKVYETSDVTKYVEKSHQRNSTDYLLDPKSEVMPFVTVPNKQLLPLPTTNIISNVSNPADVNLLMSEQRINNSEMRINITRLSDKMEQLINKVNDQNVGLNNVQVNVYQKLLNEYETKIRTYENLLQSKGILSTTSVNNEEQVTKTNQKTINDQDTIKSFEIDNLKSELNNLKKENIEKDLEISCLKKEMYLIRDSNKSKENINIEEDKMSKQCEEYAIQLLKIKEELSKCKAKFNKQEHISNENIDTEHLIKSVMNDTFQTISSSLDNEETYSGATIKNIVGAIIKKKTLEILNKCN